MDPIEIRITGENDSGAALDSAAKGIKGVGDSAKDAERPLKSMSSGLTDVGKSASRAESDLKSVGDAGETAASGLGEIGSAASKAEGKLDGLDGALDSLDSSASKGRKGAEEMAGGLEGVGESADGLETRFTGLASGIDGVTTLMDDPSPQEFAQGLADISDGVANSFVPAIKRAWEGVGNFIDRVGGMKLAAGAAAAVGIGLLTAELFKLDQQMKEETNKNLDDLSNRLQGVEYASTPVNEELIKLMNSIGKLDDLWERAKAAGDEQALAFLDLAEDAGISKDQLAEYRSELENKQAAEESGVSATDRMTEAMKAEGDAIRGVNDAVRAATDPLFAMLDAMNQNREAQRNVNELVLAYHDAIKEHGEGSAEAEQALRDLNDAQDEAVMSAADLESAEADLTAQIKEHPASLSNAKNALERWVAQGSITEGQARRMAVRFENAADEANRIQGTRKATLTADDRASGKIISAGNRLDELDGSVANVTIRAFAELIGRSLPGASFLGLAGGGRVPEYHASGGLSGGLHPGGPRGTDTVPAWLTPGEVVFNKPQQRELLNMLGGSAMGMGAARIEWGGGPSDALGRAIWDWLRENVQVSYGGDVQRALGRT